LQRRNTAYSSYRNRSDRLQHHAVGLQYVAFRIFLSDFRLEAELGHVQPKVFLVQQAAMTTFFAVERGQQSKRGKVPAPFSCRRPLYLIMMRPSCGRRFFGNVQLVSHDLQAASDLRPSSAGAESSRWQVCPSMRNLTRISSSVRLDVNIAGSALDGIRQDEVDEFDDGSLFPPPFPAWRGPSPILRRPAPARSLHQRDPSSSC